MGSTFEDTLKAEDKEKTLEFLVEIYSKTSWDFSKKKIGIIPMNFSYKQYPARITRFRFRGKQNNLTLSEKNVGVGIGNAEHSTGILI